MEKQALREKMLKARSTVSPEKLEGFSEVITNMLLSLEFVQNAKSILAYYSHKNEPDLLDFMHRCLAMGKRISLPYVSGKGEMIAVEYKIDCVMKSNVYGIPEPVLTGETQIEEPDVIIVPGVAFDEKLYRTGFGGGYYDRFLKSTDAKRIGVCFDFQIVSEIGAESHDAPMDMIVTEKRILGGLRCG